MYENCDQLETALSIFDKYKDQLSIRLWTTAIAACVHHSKEQDAINMFYDVQNAGMKPDDIVYAAILRACTKIGDFTTGTQIYSHILNSGQRITADITQQLFQMFFSQGQIPKVVAIWEQSLRGNADMNVNSWNTLLQGYVDADQAQAALDLFPEMSKQGHQPDAGTYTALLHACKSLEAFKLTQKLYTRIQTTKVRMSLPLAKALLEMYTAYVVIAKNNGSRRFYWDQCFFCSPRIAWTTEETLISNRISLH
jgi:pentatricopeptide repeat protein